MFGDSSMVFIGNTNDTIENMLRVSHLFSPFPKEYRDDSAFFDRIHCYLPGWEVPKIKSSLLTNEYGFISDYFAEFAHEMRKEDYTHSFDDLYRFNSQVNVRDEIAIRKTISGFIKILFPDGNFTREELEKIITYAIEGRRRVKEQLRAIVGEEFADVELGYINDLGKEVIVGVPEKITRTLISNEEMKPGHIYTIGYSDYFEEPAAFKIEINTVVGSGKLEVQGLYGKDAFESINAGWKTFLNIASRNLNIKNYSSFDYYLYINDLQSKRISSELSVAEVIALASAYNKIMVKESLAVIGNISLSGTLLEIKGIDEYIRLAKNAGAKIILLPYNAKRDIKEEQLESYGFDKIYFYKNIVDAVRLALEEK